ncbi:hypothetical protein ACFWNT_09390 [Streptomyces sp. NPDC058409]
MVLFASCRIGAVHRGTRKVRPLAGLPEAQLRAVEDGQAGEE